MSGFTIHELTQDTVSSYAALHAELVITTYAHLVGPEFATDRRAALRDTIDELHRDLDEAATATASGRLPRRSHWLARSPRGGVVGVAASGFGLADWEEDVCGDAWTPPATDSVLDHLYLAPGAHGSGLAQAMLELALPDRRPAYLWVISANARAVRFYERHGFAADGLCVNTGDTWGSMPMHRLQRD